jgi:light-independent protochlorophyllide reductase B subunit
MLNELIFQNCTSSHDPVVGCALEGVSNIIAGIRDISIVLHSPQGCASTVALGYDNHETDFTQRKLACTRLFETDIIMGATDKLRDLILKADATYKTKVMFVIGTCSADIIGEDIDGLCRQMQPNIGARLIPIHSGGFRGDLYAGMDIGLNTLISFVEPWNGPKLPRTVNLIAPQASLNPTWWADLKWTESVLSAMGVKTQCVFPREVSIKDLSKASAASANILLTHDMGYAFVREMEDKFDVPTILHDIPPPIGLKNTARWLRELGEYFDQSEVAEKLIESGETMVTNTLRRRGLMMIPRYRNARVAVSADASMTIGLVRMLFEELEMIPDLLLVRSNSKQARRALEAELDELGIAPRVAFGIDGFKAKEALAECDLDVVFGSAWEKYLAEELGIKVACDLLQPTNRTFYRDSAYFGYKGMINMLEILANDWEAAFRSKAIRWEQYQ